MYPFYYKNNTGKETVKGKEDTFLSFLQEGFAGVALHLTRIFHEFFRLKFFNR